MTDLEIAKTLKSAAQYIRDHGWQRGGLGIHGGGRCAVGAIASTMEDRNDYPAMSHGAFLALAAALPVNPDESRPMYVLIDWNDAAKNAAQVVDLFESVALQHELRALAVTTLSQDAATAVCDNTVPEAVNA